MIAAMEKADTFAVNFADHNITGVVRRVRAYGDDGFVIVDLDGGRTAIGELDDSDGELQAGVAYRFFGVWSHHDKYGDQFKFDSFTLSPTQAQMGIIAYLARSQLGLTKADAMRLWSAYGAGAVNVLRDDADRTIRDEVLGEDKARKASALLRDAAADEPTKIALFELFANRGFPRGTVRACIATWGPNAPKVVRKDPFQLLVRDIEGVGFTRADKLYLDLGGNPLRLKRQALAAWHHLHASTSGNTWEIDGGMYAAIVKATGSFAASEFAKAVELAVRARWISTRKDTAGATLFAERKNAASEQRLAEHIQRVMTHRTVWPAIDEQDLPDAHQRAALESLRSSPIAILAGTPGTGKTYTAAVLIRKLLRWLPSGRIAVCAPTGKAAVRITEALRRYDLALAATTIHQTLEVDGNTHDRFTFLRNESTPLDAQVVIVDEGSMLDTDLAASLFAAVPPGGNVLIVGDPYQLPPVGHGAPLRDMIAAGVPTALLTEIKRNAGQIVRACAEIKDGKRFNVAGRAIEEQGMNLVHIDAPTPRDQLQTIVSLVGALKVKGFNPIWDAQILVCTNEKSEVSRKPLNIVLQGALNPQDEAVPSDQRNATYRPGDKVICLKNTTVRLWELADESMVESKVIEDYHATDATVYVANGDMGRVMAVDASSAVVRFLLPDRVVKITTKKRRRKADAGDDAAAGQGDDAANGGGSGGDNADFDRAYAITIHKSQGSEWPVVIVALDDNAGPIGCRELLYTAISRGARIVFLVGSMKTAFKWTQKVNLKQRRTFLAELLAEAKRCTA